MYLDLEGDTQTSSAGALTNSPSEPGDSVG